MKKWTILFVSNEGKIKGLPLNQKVVFSIIILLSMFLGAFTYIVMEGTKKKALLNEYSELQTERQKYLAKLTQIKKEISTLQGNLDQLGEKNQVLLLASKLEPVSKSIKQMGVGGFPRNKEFYSGQLDSSVKRVESKINRIHNLVELEKGSFEKAGGKLTELKTRLSHIPSLWPTYGYVSSDFGWRIHPITGKREFHRGYDIANRPYTPIVATADGVISSVKWRGGLGLAIVIDHGYGFITRYGHLSKAYVHRGQRVHRGDKIGAMGSTGLSTGTHLHYEVRVLHRVVDPASYLDTFSNTY